MSNAQPTFRIDDEHGQEIGVGYQTASAAREAAQRWADSMGRTAYWGEDREGGEMVAAEPAQAQRITVTIYRAGTEWCYAMWMGPVGDAEAFDSSDSLGIEDDCTEEEARDEAARQWPSAEIRRVADVNAETN